MNLHKLLKDIIDELRTKDIQFVDIPVCVADSRSGIVDVAEGVVVRTYRGDDCVGGSVEEMLREGDIYIEIVT
jgi:hypothetical protein